MREAIEIVSNENYLFYEVEDMNELIDIFIEEGNFGEIPRNFDYPSLGGSNCL